jgi:hypothetical protein
VEQGGARGWPLPPPPSPAVPACRRLCSCCSYSGRCGHRWGQRSRRGARLYQGERAGASSCERARARRKEGACSSSSFLFLPRACCVRAVRERGSGQVQSCSIGGDGVEVRLRLCVVCASVL